ncbi:MAG: DUF1801 domain-containing protein [Pedobacter sp.]|nr:DUF1801 domain-containing protein [Pedobacter sp.]MDQ8053417.1 DUF1801 domain-containing protein [Pedobacter sp.]
MAELKTRVTAQPVEDYFARIENDELRKDCETICKIMEDVTATKAKMWGPAIVGVGDYNYRYDSGRNLDWFMMGFSPRKANISLYLLGCNLEEDREILSRFGKHKTGKGCIYVKRLSDINVDVLKELCELSYQKLKS